MFFACSCIKMAVVECDSAAACIQYVCVHVFVVHTCMATCIFQHEVLLQLFPVQYYTCFQHTAEFKKCVLNNHQGYFMFCFFILYPQRKNSVKHTDIETCPVHVHIWIQHSVFNISSSESRNLLPFINTFFFLSAPRSSTVWRTRNEEETDLYGVLPQEHSEKRLQERGSLGTSDCRDGNLLVSTLTTIQ